MRKTKIVCTLGPATEDPMIVRELMLSGMNVARLNFSHNTHDDHRRRIEVIKELRKELQFPVAILLDTKGPEYRIGTFAAGRIRLEAGETFIFTADDVQGDETRVSVNYKKLPQELGVGDTVLLNNGLLSFRVDAVSGADIICTVVTGGELSDRKSMSFPGKVMHQIYLSEQDKRDIQFGVENGVDYIACSFVSCKQNLVDVRAYLEELGATDVELIAKIENQSGVDHIEEICECCDGIMIARGDMGVEIPFEHLPAIQKMLIAKCSMLGKRVITATEMLESMITNPRPTRAEISDIANAVYDGTSAIMLSGETAAGKYPVQAVEAMARIAEFTESTIDYKKRFHDAYFKIRNMTDAISHSTCGMAMDIEAKAIVACTLSGVTARMISRFRAPVPIIGLTTNEVTWRKLALSWGVTPAICEQFPSTEVLFYSAKKIAVSTFGLTKGDRLVITGGNTTGHSGNTNLIKIDEIK